MNWSLQWSVRQKLCYQVLNSHASKHILNAPVINDLIKVVLKHPDPDFNLDEVDTELLKQLSVDIDSYYMHCHTDQMLFESHASTLEWHMQSTAIKFGINVVKWELGTAAR